MSPPRQHYKIKLENGRILGPIDLERIRLLIRKNRLTGSEAGREYPEGEWREISMIPAIAEVFLEVARHRLKEDLPPEDRTKSAAVQVQPQTADPQGPTYVLPGATEILPQPLAPTTLLPGAGNAQPAPTLVPLAVTAPTEIERGTQATIALTEHALDPTVRQEEATIVTQAIDSATRAELSVARAEPPRDLLAEIEQRRRAGKERNKETRLESVPLQGLVPVEEQVKGVAEFTLGQPAPGRDISQEKTIVFQSPAYNDHGTGPGKRRTSMREKLTATLAAVILGFVGYQLFLETPTGLPDPRRAPIRPRLPDPIAGQPNSKLSEEAYNLAMKSYVLDNVEGYRQAAEKLRIACSLDPRNVRALAMLASSYLNLIDSSNKDENYFTVISKLIELTRAKEQDIPQTVIPDVEFYITVNKPEAAQARVVEYAKSHQTLPIELYYYLALAFHARGNEQAAARYLAQIPDEKAFSPKVYFLRGQLAEKLGDNEHAVIEYRKAVARWDSHVRSRLRIADIFYQRGSLKDGATQLDYIVQHPRLMAPIELARAYYLHAQLAGSYEKWDLALGDIERAVRLDKDNHDYLLEMYTLEAKAGENVTKFRSEARMYFYLGEGEKQLRLGKYHEALTQFLLARQANSNSPIPPVKIGDMFMNLHDMSNARMNYRLAADRAPKNIEIWSKYISVLIVSYEFEEAQIAMNRFREIPGTASTIDKLAGDLYEKQGMHAEAQSHYQNAMKRDSIDSGVYIAYANSLMASKKFDQAPFFFALAMRLDPLNVDSIVGTAKCVAESDSKDRAIRMLQDELQKNSYPAAELLAAIAELYMNKGSNDDAQKYIDQAMTANPDYAYPWKLQAMIYMDKADREKDALDRALAAYQAYSDRNPSDPSGYRDRYTIYLRKSDYDKASDELSKIFAIYPKYSNLHLYKGVLYSIMQNHKYAIEELTSELKNSPNNTTAMVALGKEYLSQGEPNKALGLLNQAMALEPRSSNAKLNAGYANFQLKNYTGAIALYNAALVFDPNNPAIYMRLSQAYFTQGDIPASQAACRKYLQLDPQNPDKECLRYR